MVPEVQSPLLPEEAGLRRSASSLFLLHTPGLGRQRGTRVAARPGSRGLRTLKAICGARVTPGRGSTSPGHLLEEAVERIAPREPEVPPTPHRGRSGLRCGCPGGAEDVRPPGPPTGGCEGRDEALLGLDRRPADGARAPPVSSNHRSPLPGGRSRPSAAKCSHPGPPGSIEDRSTSDGWGSDDPQVQPGSGRGTLRPRGASP